MQEKNKCLHICALLNVFVLSPTTNPGFQNSPCDLLPDVSEMSLCLECTSVYRQIAEKLNDLTGTIANYT